MAFFLSPEESQFELAQIKNARRENERTRERESYRDFSFVRLRETRMRARIVMWLRVCVQCDVVSPTRLGAL